MSSISSRMLTRFLHVWLSSSNRILLPKKRESYGAAVALGAMAWNLSLMPPEDRLGPIRDAVRAAVAIGLPLTEDWLTKLVERKVLLFPSDDRFIESYEVVVAPDGRLTVLIASSIDI